MFDSKALRPLLDTGKSTYVHDEEVQPAPVVGEVFLETVGDPLQTHL